MKKYVIILCMALSGCCSLTNKCFVDKRFNLKLEALSKTVRDTYLTPTKITFESGQEYSFFYFGCKLKENRMNFVKFICDGTHWADNDINNEQIVITYEINLQKDKIFEQYVVEELTYEQYPRDKEWHRSGGGYYLLQEENI